jgi:large subunit ribosomal protein L32
MALALRYTQRSASLPWLKTLLPATALLATALPGFAHRSLQSLLELFPSIVLAVPKKKVSHSRKAMRASNKGLKDKQSQCA